MKQTLPDSFERVTNFDSIDYNGLWYESTAKLVALFVDAIKRLEPKDTRRRIIADILESRLPDKKHKSRRY